jgi:hypothetical protein
VGGGWGFRWGRSRCRLLMNPTVCNEKYVLLPFDTAGRLPRIPPMASESLCAPVEHEDLELFLDTLPNCNAAVGMPCELLRHAPDTLTEAMRVFINLISTGQAAVPPSWLGGLVRFLHKHCDSLEARNYLPMCLQDTDIRH